ncbi:hypothetical protein AAU61_02090 [Desulfocarbo indianensis]|nr:hypothetical protein AAU61_02090 [Desulfocarbo indianensis]
MSDLRIQYNEEMVGRGHPTKADTLNRLFLAGGMRSPEGKNHWAVFKKQTGDPPTAADELALYAKEEGGELALYARPALGGPAWRLI